MSHYETLGVGRNADKSAVKRAYRKRAHEHHPDKGGSAEKFHAVQKAYDVLGDDARRAWYDRHGTDGQVNSEDQALQQLGALFVQVVEQADVDRQDVLAIVRENIERARANFQKSIEESKQRVRKLESAKKRLKKKTSGPSLLEQMLEAQVSAQKRAMELGTEHLKIGARMLELLADYAYKADAAQYVPAGLTMFRMAMG